MRENIEDSICGYIISFREGHSFKHEEECVEWGEIVEELFKNENYGWFANDTEYRPEKYYETVWTFKIKEKKHFQIGRTQQKFSCRGILGNTQLLFFQGNFQNH